MTSCTGTFIENLTDWNTALAVSTVISPTVK